MNGVVESDSLNRSSRSLLLWSPCGKLIPISMRFKFLASIIQVEFKHVDQSANGLVDSLIDMLLCFLLL